MYNQTMLDKTWMSQTPWIPWTKFVSPVNFTINKEPHRWRNC